MRKYLFLLSLINTASFLQTNDKKNTKSNRQICDLCRKKFGRGERFTQHFTTEHHLEPKEFVDPFELVGIVSPAPSEDPIGTNLPELRYGRHTVKEYLDNHIKNVTHDGKK